MAFNKTLPRSFIQNATVATFALLSSTAMAWQTVPAYGWHPAPVAPQNPGPHYAYGTGYQPGYWQAYATPQYAGQAWPVRYQQPQANHQRLPTPQPPATIRTEEETKKVTSGSTASPTKAISHENIKAKKQGFIERLLPAIEQENTRLRQQRQRALKLLQPLAKPQTLSQENRDWLQRMAKSYRVKGNPLTDSSAGEELLQKIDIIPASLTLAQAANESAWGQSRFAREANNLFGIWTYDASQGLEPKQRESGKQHLVRKFDSIEDSVSHYMLLLNSHPAYQKLRDLRHELRQQQKPLDGQTLAAGLEKYSAKGERYIERIRTLIRQNQWAKLDNPSASA